MFKALLKTRLLALWHTMFARSTAKSLSKGKKMLIGVLAFYIIIQLSVSTGALYSFLANGMLEAGMLQLYFCMAALLGFSMCFIGSVYMAQSLIFDARDTELLVSMPIPPRYIVASRFLPLFVLNYLYSCVMIMPCIVVYFSKAGFDSVVLLLFIIAFLLLPFIAAAATCLFGWVTAILTTNAKHRNMLQAVLMIILLGAYMVINFNMQNYLTKLIENGNTVLAAIEKALPPFYWFGEAVANRDPVALIKYALCCVIPFALIYAIISKTFLKLSTNRKSETKKKYVQGSIKVSSARAAMLRKELRCFFSMPNYMLNCGIGVIFALMLAVAIIVKGDSLLVSMFPVGEGSNYIPAIYCAAICFCIFTCNPASVSISLEGKSFSILKAMPLRAIDVFAAKALAGFVIILPSSVISVFAGWYAFDVSPLYKLGMLAVCLSACVFCPSFGITMNAHLPRFDWLNATVIIKQSMSSMIAIFGGIGVIALPIVLYVTALKNYLSVEIYSFIVAGALLLASAGMLLHLNKKGESLYRHMG